MIYTTEKPISFEFNIPEYRYKNQEYALSIFTPTGYKEVYRGLTFFNKDGETRIYVDRVLRDYIYVNEIEYTNTQQFRPINMIGSNTDVLETIENKGRFIVTTIKVQIFGNSQSLNTASKDVTCVNGYFYEYGNTYIRNPYEGNYKFLTNLSTINKVLSHIPASNTDNMWLGLIFSLSRGSSQAKLRISNGTTSMPLNHAYYGNYSTSIPLSLINTSIGLNGGDKLTLISDDAILKFTPIAIVDECPADYYVAFSTNYSWTCLPFNGNVYIDNNSDNVRVVNYLGLNKVVSNVTHTTLNLYTEYLDEKTYITLMGILNASNVYVYDVKNDRGIWCTVNNSNTEGLPNKNRKPKYFNLQLTEAYNFKS